MAAVRDWLEGIEIDALHIQPGIPWQNGYAESFHARFRDEFLAMEEFETLSVARQQTPVWQEDYNSHRPHSSLGYVPPSEFATRCTASAPADGGPALQQHSKL